MTTLDIPGVNKKSERIISGSSQNYLRPKKKNLSRLGRVNFFLLLDLICFSKLFCITTNTLMMPEGSFISPLLGEGFMERLNMIIFCGLK
jgi:hypothetical protein